APTETQPAAAPRPRSFKSSSSPACGHVRHASGSPQAPPAPPSRNSQVRQPRLDSLLNGVPNRTNTGKLLLVGSGQGRRIWKTPVNPLVLAGEHRAALGIRLVADGNDIVKHLASIDKILGPLGKLPLGRNAQLLHGPNNKRIQLPRLDARALHLEPVAGQMPQHRLANLTPARIMDANEHYSLLFHARSF